MRQLRVITRSLTSGTLEALVRALFTADLDYCNALLAGAADSQLKRLQSIPNTAARLVSAAQRCERNVAISTQSPGTGFQYISESPSRSCGCVSVVLCPDRRRPRVSTATVCIYSMYSVTVPTTEGEDVNGTAKFCVPCAVSLEQFVVHSARQQFVSRAFGGSRRCISSVVDNNEHHPALPGRFVIVAPSVNIHTNVLTYLLDQQYPRRE